MKIPRDISGRGIIKALKVFGYETVRQNGSHIMVTSIKNGEHHLVIPYHNPLKVGTLKWYHFSGSSTLSTNKRRGT